MTVSPSTNPSSLSSGSESQKTAHPEADRLVVLEHGLEAGAGTEQESGGSTVVEPGEPTSHPAEAVAPVEVADQARGVVVETLVQILVRHSEFVEWNFVLPQMADHRRSPGSGSRTSIGLRAYVLDR